MGVSRVTYKPRRGLGRVGLLLIDGQVFDLKVKGSTIS